MAIHVADGEVTRLLKQYAGQTGMTQTEALRRLLHRAVEEEERKRRKKDLRRVTEALWEQGA